MVSFEARLQQEDERRLRDAERLQQLDGDLCQLCEAYGPDKRSLFLDCFYAVHEVVPEAIDLLLVEKQNDSKHASGYYLRICKSCRGRLLDLLRHWRDDCVSLRGVPKNHDGGLEDEREGANIPVRLNGRIVMMTMDEYGKWSAEKR